MICLCPIFLARAMLSRTDIDSVVMGMENRTQLRQNLALLNQPPLDAEILARIEAFEPAIPGLAH